MTAGEQRRGNGDASLNERTPNTQRVVGWLDTRKPRATYTVNCNTSMHSNVNTQNNAPGDEVLNIGNEGSR